MLSPVSNRHRPLASQLAQTSFHVHERGLDHQIRLAVSLAAMTGTLLFALYDSPPELPSKQRVGIYRADLKVNPAYASSIDACIIHEAMHSFGFISHPHAADSVLSYVYKRRALTALDRHLIRTLYDPRLAPNLAAQPASQLACRILGERLAVSGADIEAVCSARKGPAA
jgi:hypothetical protein